MTVAVKEANRSYCAGDLNAIVDTHAGVWCQAHKQLFAGAKNRNSTGPRPIKVAPATIRTSRAIQLESALNRGIGIGRSSGYLSAQ